MEKAEQLLNDLMEIIKTVSDTQSSQSRVIDKLSDGLLRATCVLSNMKNEISLLKKQVEILEMGATK